jgi:hypothetical protein
MNVVVEKGKGGEHKSGRTDGGASGHGAVT